MNEFNFNSQVCTSRSQSERLLKLGLKKETADMCHFWHWESDDYSRLCASWEFAHRSNNDLPAWSLGRLLALVNGEDWNAEITLKDERYGIHTGFDTMWYDDIFEAVIAWIEEDIKEGYFNKEYLEEKK